MLNQNQITNELDFTNSLLQKLEPYYSREVRDLPEALITELRKIKIGPKITTSGLEKVSNITLGLLIAKQNLEEALEDPEGFKTRYKNTKQTNTDMKKETNNKILKNSKPTTQEQLPKPVVKSTIETIKPVISPKPAEKIQIKIENPINKKSTITDNQPPIANNPPIKITIKPDITSQPKPPKQTQTPPTASKIDL